MRNSIEIFDNNTTDDQRFNTYINSGQSLDRSFNNVPALKILTSEGSDNFINYIKWLGINKDSNPVVLSSQHHYYYDAEEMKNVDTVINLKELNQIKQISSFLHSIFHNLHHNCNFVGCFVDNNKTNGYELKNSLSNYDKKKRFDDIENGIISRNPFLNMLFSIMDLRTNKYMSKRIVSKLLNDHGFKVLDMTELNGLTYFCAQRLWIAEN